MLKAALATALTGLMFPVMAQAQTMLVVPGTGYQDSRYSDVDEIGKGFFPDVDSVVVHYPANFSLTDSVQAGGDNLYAAIQSTDGPLIIVGESQGAVVLDRVQGRLVHDPNAPAPDRLRFVMFGDPERGVLNKYLGPGTRIPVVNWTVEPPVESQYDTTLVVAEYDGWADPPDRPWNLLATANALMGAGASGWILGDRPTRDQAVHGFTAQANINDVPPENINTTTNLKGATVTHMLVPTQQLPLTKPLRGVVPDKLVDRLDDRLRPHIDKAYVRHDEPDDTRPYVSGGQVVRPSKKAEPTTTAGPVRKLRNELVDRVKGFLDRDEPESEENEAISGAEEG